MKWAFVQEEEREREHPPFAATIVFIGLFTERHDAYILGG